MKKATFFLLTLFAVGAFLPACKSEDDDVKLMKEWRDVNNEWLAEMQARKNADGTPYYKVVVPKWDPSSFVLMHYFNERTDDPLALTPLYTSTVDVRYRLTLYNGVACDSSSTMTENGPGIYRAQLNDLVDGWAAAVCEMNVGDTAEVIIPYALGYGSMTMGSIPAYSNLKFNIRLADIYLYEKSPEEDDSSSN